MKISLLILLVFSITFGNAQKLKLIQKLPDSLHEISGLTFLNDTILVTHNDGGNDAILYFLNLNGEVIHQVEIDGAKNTDWEAITLDGEFLYIGDIGNNSNNRKDLIIYKVSCVDILNKKSVAAEKIEISYQDQVAFPPSESSFHYDAEAMTFYKDSLHIFTKCNSKPFDGNSYHYIVSTKPGKYTLTKRGNVYVGTKGFFKDAITDVTIHDETYWFLTYNRMIGYKLIDDKFKLIKTIPLKPYSQKEAIITKDNKLFYIADEKHPILGGGKLYQLTINGK